MTFAKGQSGNPGGRGTDRPWADALRLCAAEPTPDGRKKLRALADKTFDLALDGNIEAIKEIGNRFDGRPKQQVDIEANVMLAGQDPATVLAARRKAREGNGG